MANITEEREAQSVVNQSSEWIIAIMHDEGEPSISNITTSRKKIQKVPEKLREMHSNKSWYDPEVVSIGPFHHENRELKSFEKFKTKLMRDYVRRCTESSPTELYNKVAGVASKARECYAEGSTERYDDPTFTQMMILDGCFVLQFIICNVIAGEGLMKMNSRDRAFVQRDLFLLENQLPFIVLETLMTLRFEKSEGWQLIDYFIKKTFWKAKIFVTKTPHQRDKKPFVYPGGKPYHLLDIWRRLIVLVDCFSNYYAWVDFPRRTARDLKKVGISLRPSETLYWDRVEFHAAWSHGTLTLPRINIDETTLAMLLNVVAYEHSSADLSLSVTNYICFLNSLISHADDVKELKYAGILNNFLKNDEEAAEAIHGIAAGLVPGESTWYADVRDSIERHHRHTGRTRIATWVSEAMRDYFRSPWTTIAVFYAMLAIVLTFIQTYFTVFPPPDKS